MSFCTVRHQKFCHFQRLFPLRRLRHLKATRQQKSVFITLPEQIEEMRFWRYRKRPPGEELFESFQVPSLIVSQLHDPVLEVIQDGSATERSKCRCYGIQRPSHDGTAGNPASRDEASESQGAEKLSYTCRVKDEFLATQFTQLKQICWTQGAFFPECDFRSRAIHPLLS